MSWRPWRREVPPPTPDPVEEEQFLLVEETEIPGDGEFEFDEGDGEFEFGKDWEYADVDLELLIWRMEYRHRSVVVGSTQDLGDGERLWFRIRNDNRGDRFYNGPYVAEVRTGDRARERAETALRMYVGMRWTMADGPRIVQVPFPDWTEADVLAGGPLVDWARDLAERFTSGDL